MFGCRKVRVSDAKVNDIHAFLLLLCFHLVNPCKKVRGEIAHSARVHNYYLLAS